MDMPGVFRLPVRSGVMLIDEPDAHLVLDYMLYLNNRGYAMLGSPLRLVHRLIMGSPPGADVDHINGDKLDNRRCNLRVVSHAKNCQNRRRLNANNTSGATGVYWRQRVHCWQARISVDGKHRSLGYFKDKSVAVAVRQAAEREHYDLPPDPGPPGRSG